MGHFIDTAILREADVRVWFLELVKEGQRLKVIDDENGAGLKGAIEHPDDIGDDTWLFYIRSLEHLYRTVVEGHEGERLRLEKQSFGSRFTLFRPSAGDIVLETKSGEPLAVAPKPKVGEESLFQRYPDVSAAARGVGKLFREIPRPERNVFIDLHLARMAAALDRIAKGGVANQHEAREQIAFIEQTIRVMGHFMVVPRPELEKHSLTLFESAAAYHGKAAEDDWKPLAATIKRLRRTFATMGGDDDVRELMVVAFLRIREIKRKQDEARREKLLRGANWIEGELAFVEVGGGDPPGVKAAWLADKLYRRKGRTPTLGELASVARFEIEGGDPKAAIEDLEELGTSPIEIGTALLMASWSFRLGRADHPLWPLVLREIHRPILLGRDPADAAVPQEIGVRPVEDRLLDILSQGRDFGMPLSIELGPGDLPYGILLARNDRGSRVISVDPAVLPVDWGLLLPAAPPRERSAPENFEMLSGLAQYLTPFAAGRPIAKNVAIVAPLPGELLPMLLSALLLVKKGGAVDLYLQKGTEALPLELLEALRMQPEFSTVVSKQEIPPSRGLSVPAVHVHIQVGTIEEPRGRQGGMGGAPKRDGFGKVMMGDEAAALPPALLGGAEDDADAPGRGGAPTRSGAAGPARVMRGNTVGTAARLRR